MKNMKTKVKRTTQDDTREREQIKLFNLKGLQGRSNKYIPDATIEVLDAEHFFELKTSDIERKEVSTARNITLPKLELYKKVWWIFTQYQKTNSGFEFTGEHYVAYGEDLKEWLEKQAHKIKWGTKTYGGLENWNECRKILEENNLYDIKELNRLDNSFHKKGCGLNDPKISWKFVQQVGIKIDSNRPAQHLREIVLKKVLDK
mgnify:CR=1 FL=1